MSTEEKKDKMLTAYLVCALWSSHDETDEDGGEPFDRNYGIEDFAPEALQEASDDVKAFVAKARKLLDKYSLDDESVGHDFWLTRNGHGAGFWDRGYKDNLGDKLTAISKTFKEIHPYLGDDGKIYFG